MAVRELTSGEIEALVGTRHVGAGFEYPANGLQPYYEWLMRALHLLGESGAGELRVDGDEAGGAQVWVAPGRAVIGGGVAAFDGGTVDLGTLNNETVNVWAQASDGIVTIGAGVAGDGWPAGAHVKLAAVTISAGEVISIVDRRGEGRLIDGHARFGYGLELTTQGDTSTPSVMTISLVDAQGERAKLQDVLRVRVTDEGAFGAATNATIAAGGGTSVAETIDTGKDLVLRSNADGVFEISLTNGVAETAVVRIGAAQVGGRLADWSGVLAVAHV